MDDYEDDDADESEDDKSEDDTHFFHVEGSRFELLQQHCMWTKWVARVENHWH